MQGGSSPVTQLRTGGNWQVEGSWGERMLFYHNQVVLKQEGKVLVVSLATGRRIEVQIGASFRLQLMPPGLFVALQGQNLRLFGEEGEQLWWAKISKMEPLTVCGYNKGYFLGGYNKSRLPGHKRTNRKQLYYLEHIQPHINNKPDYVIPLPQSEHPVERIAVQNPYLLIYCEPVYYVMSLFQHTILLTFSKESKTSLLLEGRWATSTLNGVGLSYHGTIFTFDVERLPVFGVEVTEHVHACECLCLQRTGRVFGGRSNTVFEYFPFKKHSKCWTMYPEGHQVVAIQFTPANNLVVFRRTEPNKYMLDTYAVE